MSTTSTQDRVRGTLLGLALGDAFGAPFEGGPIERMVWALIGKTRDGKKRWTDDTQMSLDLAESLSAHGELNAEDVAKRFADSYRWSRGYGPAAAKTLKRIRRGVPWQEANRAIYKEGSLGNGGAMRAPILGVFFSADRAALLEAARLGASITHAHPLGVDASAMIALATARAMEDPTPDAILDAASDKRHPELAAKLERAAQLLEKGHDLVADDLREQFGVGMLASESPVAALCAACVYLDSDYKEMVRFLTSCGGDVDTMCAIAGGIWGAARGYEALPQGWLDKLEDAERILAVADRLSEARPA